MRKDKIKEQADPHEKEKEEIDKNKRKRRKNMKIWDTSKSRYQKKI